MPAKMKVLAGKLKDNKNKSVFFLSIYVKGECETHPKLIQHSQTELNQPNVAL